MVSGLVPPVLGSLLSPSQYRVCGLVTGIWLLSAHCRSPPLPPPVTRGRDLPLTVFDFCFLQTWTQFALSAKSLSLTEHGIFIRLVRSAVTVRSLSPVISVPDGKRTDGLLWTDFSVVERENFLTWPRNARFLLSQNRRKRAQERG